MGTERNLLLVLETYSCGTWKPTDLEPVGSLGGAEKETRKAGSICFQDVALAYINC